MTRTDLIKNTLEKIADEGFSYLRPENASNSQKFSVNMPKIDLDQIFLQYILLKSNIDSKSLIKKPLIDELSFWNRKYLANLAFNVDIYLQDELTKEKFSYLIEHSIKGDLVNSLLSGNIDDKFAVYNQHVISGLKKFGISDKWFSHGNNLTYRQSRNPKNNFDIEIVEWKRDFRSEYAIGNISDCCIAINNEQTERKFKPVLLDYFLDNTLKVLHFKVDGKKIGQIYLLSMVEEGKSCMGITSVELNKDFKESKNANDLVPPMAEALIGEGGYQDIYGFESVFISPRFNLFREYLKDKKQAINNMQGVLKQRKRDYTQQKGNERKHLYSIPVSGSEMNQSSDRMSKLVEQIETITGQIGLLERIKEDMYSEKIIPFRKIGFKEATEPYKESWHYSDSNAFFGTNYLDVCGLREDGFFNVFSPPNRTNRGFLIKKDGYINEIESALRIMNETYVKKK